MSNWRARESKSSLGIPGFRHGNTDEPLGHYSWFTTCDTCHLPTDFDWKNQEGFPITTVGNNGEGPQFVKRLFEAR